MTPQISLAHLARPGASRIGHVQVALVDISFGALVGRLPSAAGGGWHLPHVPRKCDRKLATFQVISL